ncbi:MAG: hypothetical protein QME79_04645 [Bacillota bacterium]|nr:hypothetical protein [Bacillota bacterium]
MPWDNIVVRGIAWGPLVSVVISVLKALGMDKKYIRWVMWILGFLGLFLYQYLSGASLWQSIVSGLIAVAAAPGFYEAYSKPIQNLAIKTHY